MVPAQGLRRIVKNDPRTRLQDVEGVHQMRVGARRLRSDLRTFGALVAPEWANDLSQELKWLAQALGEVRDLDVLEERLKTSARDIGVELQGLWNALEERRLQALDALDQVLVSDRYRSLLDQAIECAVSPVSPTRPKRSVAWLYLRSPRQPGIASFAADGLSNPLIRTRCGMAFA